MGRERNHRSEYSTRKTGIRNTATPNTCSAKSLRLAPTTPIQLCAGLEAGGVDAVLNDGSSGEYDASARTRRTAKTNTRNPISSLSRRLAVGEKARYRESTDAGSPMSALQAIGVQIRQSQIIIPRKQRGAMTNKSLRVGE